MKMTVSIALAILGILSLSSAALSQNVICAKNFILPGMDPCARGIPGFVYLKNATDPNKPVCSRTYDDSHCKNMKTEFIHAETTAGGYTCIINFNQSISGNYCAQSPNEYDYVKEPWD